MAVILVSTIVFFSLFCGVYLLPVESCPMYGCRPSGTFSYVLDITSNVSLAWPKSFVQGPYLNSLGCAANDVNIVCQANGLRDEGYVTLIPDNGTVAWYGDILRRPTLPIMDIYGDVIGTDGHNLVMFDSDGKIEKPLINLGESLFPTYSLTLSEENGIIAIVSRQGLLITKESNGIPHASMDFRAEEERTNGTFIPVAPPVVSGHRIYILTEFRPDYSIHQPDILGMQRLFAIDMKNVMMGRLETAWVFNFERLDRLGPLVGEYQQNKQDARNENQEEVGFGVAPQILKNTDTDMIYVNLPPPEGVTNAVHLLWGFKDVSNGTDPDLIFKIPQPLSKIAMFESNSGPVVDKRKNKISGKTYKPLTQRRKINNASLWGVSVNGKLILQLNSNDGTVKNQINLDSALNMTSSVVTSKIMVARSSDSSEDILIFGVQITPPKTGDGSKGFRKLKGKNTAKDSPKNYVVSFRENKVNWVFETPNNREVKGQIAGVQRSSVDGSDLLVVFTSDSEESEVFALKFDRVLETPNKLRVGE
ncbi:uncharacterized protein LOC133197570 [Saccostrea echinata]|uniref:uncharacterized protein LOC133197570 n=1 Tax=Saccostrea echinata TaxID=191078 RepID=UPI002A82C8C3|nr:uncharacterized protein LOC133197570 [Saccostrea echinata]